MTNFYFARFKENIPRILFCYLCGNKFPGLIQYLKKSLGFWLRLWSSTPKTTKPKKLRRWSPNYPNGYVEANNIYRGLHQHSKNKHPHAYFELD